jgi:general secretion pathway protein F
MTAVATFRYEALTAAGDRTAGEIEGVSRAAVIAKLQDSGYLPIGADEIRTGNLRRWLGRELFEGGGARLAGRHLAVATQELATLLKAGLPLDRALDMLVELAEAKRVRTVFAAVLEQVRGGASLADAMHAQGTAFPPLYVTMVRAGERGGALDATLARLADFLAKSHATREAVKSALVYPAILVVVAGLSLVIVLTVVLPQFKPLFHDAGAALPLPTQIVMAVGDVVQDVWWIALLAIAAASLGFRRALATIPSFALSWHRLLLFRVPLVRTLIAKTETARFARTLGTLAANGVTLPSALTLSRETIANRAMAGAVDDVVTRLKEGEGLAAPLAGTGVFPRLATQLMRVGEETGRLDEMLLNVADIFDREVQRTIERMLVLLTPALTIGLGMMIAGIIASVLLAILSVNDLAL